MKRRDCDHRLYFSGIMPMPKIISQRKLDQAGNNSAAVALKMKTGRNRTRTIK